MLLSTPFYQLENAGVDAWIVRLFDEIHSNNLDVILSLEQACRSQWPTQLLDVVPSYTTLLVHFDIQQLDSLEVYQQLQYLIKHITVTHTNANTDFIEIPVWYDPSVGVDLPLVAQKTRMSVQDIIALHTHQEYRVFALGFAPGFAFMGVLPQALQLPRLSTPRQQVPAGSVAIAAQQTAVYPCNTPGGWHILGRTPLQLFDTTAMPMSRLQTGDRVKFTAIDAAQFIALGGDTTPMEIRQ